MRLLNPPKAAVLKLDLHALELYEATPWTLRRLELGDIPTNLDEATRFDDPEKSLQFRSVSASSGPGGNTDAAFHSQGLTGDETRQKNIRRFFEAIDSQLVSQLPSAEMPLMLFGPEEEIGHYREVNHYPHLLARAVAHNPSDLDADEFRAMACEALAAYEREQAAARLEALGDASGKGLACLRVEELPLAAEQGRIDTLFLHAGDKRYGKIDRERGEVTVHVNQEPGDTELLAFTARAAALAGAGIRVFEEPESPLPDRSPVAAILRW